MLTFDAETARFLDRVYQGSDVTRRRRVNFDALVPAPGQTLVDLGCGTGLLTAELARAVGPEGRVIGLDISADMRRSAAARCAEMPWVEIGEGGAESLPLGDGEADGLVSVQVMEYVPDTVGALREAARVVRPGGRVVIGDIHFQSWVWRSDHPERMARVMAAWDRHLVHRDLPEQLPGLMPLAGLGVERVEVVPFCDWQMRPDGLAALMLTMIQRYVVSEGLIPEAEAEAWAGEQRALAAEGRFWFSLDHVVTCARRL